MNSLICSLAIVYILGFCLRQLQWSGNGADTLHFGRREFRGNELKYWLQLQNVLINGVESFGSSFLQAPKKKAEGK